MVPAFLSDFHSQTSSAWPGARQDAPKTCSDAVSCQIGWPGKCEGFGRIPGHSNATPYDKNELWKLRSCN